MLASRGTEWQLLKDYQFRRIDTFLDPASDPLGAGYHITQSKIALGSGGMTGRGFMQGTQSRLNFLPEKHTDFIFTTLAEEFGFVGAASLLSLYALVIVFCIVSALTHQGPLLVTADPRASPATFFLYFRGQHVDGDGAGAGGRRAAAAGLLWRLGDAGAAGRLRSGAERPCPQAEVTTMMANVLFAAGDADWPDYEGPLTAALSEAGVAARLARDFPAPGDVDCIVYAPGGPVSDFSPYVNAKAVLALWAGVESIVGNPTLTQPLARMVDPGLTEGMVEWVTGHVLRHHLGMDRPDPAAGRGAGGRLPRRWRGDRHVGDSGARRARIAPARRRSRR